MSEDEDGNDSELGVYDNATYWARFGPDATLDQAELDYLDGRSVEEDDGAEEYKAEDGLQDLLDEEMLDFEAHVNSGSSSEDTADETDAAEEQPQLQPPPPEAPPAQQTPKRQRLCYKQPPPPAYAEPQPSMKRPASKMKRPASKAEPPAPLPPPDTAPPPASSGRKRPASTRRPRPNELCTGFNGTACRFSTTEAGKAARMHPDRHEQQCLFCNKDKLEAASKMTRRNILTMALKKFRAMSEQLCEDALNRVRLFLGNDVAEDFARRAGARPAPPPAPRPPATDWTALLEHRKPVGAELKRKEREEYSKAVKRDQRVARRKLFFPDRLMKRAGEAQEEEEREAVARSGQVVDLADNDVGLPGPTEKDGQMVETWCKQGSWAMCEKCHSICPRPLQPVDLRRAAKGAIPPSQCTACKHKEYVPQPEHVPRPLRRLKEKVIEALRPLEISTGPYERAPNGYRTHTAMFQTHWKEVSVLHQIAQLRKRRDRRAAREAYDYLMGAADSAYASFIERHQEFLAKHGKHADMEEEGLECCLWPHLYWHRNLCETVARAAHEARCGRKPGRRRSVMDSSDEEEEAVGLEGNEEEEMEDQEEEDDEEGGGPAAANIETSTQGRIKRGFLRKVLSPVMGYGADYQLLHFVYDLSIWTTVGTKKNLANRNGVALRHMLKGCAWTPQYWRIRHQALIDMQRQCGNATLFRTRAPYERTFPYHRWIMHEQAALGRPRMHLAMAETLHMAHVLLQLDKGYICGDMARTGRQDRTWTSHVLGPADGSNTSTVVGHVTRLEFQDGKRKRATQKYHGRGTVHSHSLDHLENVEVIGLEHKLGATVPAQDAEPFLHGLVMDSQCDYKDSKLPVREEPSAWDPETKKALLQHRPEDKDLHLRAYMRPTMPITKCHEDVQQADGNGNTARYVATYSSKFSNSMGTEWLRRDASDYSTAAGVLRRHRPLEPEMILTLAQERFPQFDVSGTILDIMAPGLDPEAKPPYVERYEQAVWRRDDMPLIEFLRKSNKDGSIINYIQEKHKQQAMEEARALLGEDSKAFAKQRQQLLSRYNQRKKELKRQGQPKQALDDFLREQGFDGITSLEAFANNYVCRGEKLVAATTYSMLNDKYYGQWHVLFQPFRQVEQFAEEAPEVMEKVPEKYRNFALCMHHAPDYWGNDARIKDAMELEAHNKAHIDTILSKVRAQRHIVERYLSGEIPVTEILPSEEEDEDAEEGAANRSKKVKLTHSQKRLSKAMNKQLENATRAAEAEDDKALEACVQEAEGHKMLFASGPPGTGKTFVIHEAIKHWSAKGARILFGLPTGQLAAEIRAIHPNIDVDTNHGAFLLHRDLQEAASILTQYDLVIIDEVSMLTAEHFEHILALWKYAEQLPCMVLLGDFWQLPVVDRNAERCECSPAWSSHVHVINFHEQVRCKCPILQKKLDVLRTGVPSAKFLNKKIARNHRAWKTNSPTAYDIVELYREHEDTTVITCTRKATAIVNQLAIEAFFEGRHKTPLGTLGLDYESNQENYTSKGKLIDGKLEAASTVVYEGMRVFLTQNINKENDFVNGMAATILDYDARSRCLQVLTRTRQRLAVHMVTRELDDGRKVACFPVRLGYACTVPKIQGMTLPHITLWLDVPGCKAASYVAMSRVQRDEEYLIAGKVCPAHFVPAQ